MSGDVVVVQGPAPNERRDPLVRRELKKASVWIGLVCTAMIKVALKRSSEKTRKQEGA